MIRAHRRRRHRQLLLLTKDNAMKKERDLKSIREMIRRGLTVALTLMVAFVLLVPAVPVSADTEPVREVHKVKVGKKKYCFFTERYVVMTLAEINNLIGADPEEEAGGNTDGGTDGSADGSTDGSTDGGTDGSTDGSTENMEINYEDYDDLTMEILKRAGLYMKESNCKNAKHKAIKPEDWVKSGGSFRLYDEDIAAILEAAPEDGKPVKIDMDLILYTNAPADEQPAEGYTTFKTVGPRILLLAIATEEDAKAGEDICEEEKKDEPKKKKEKKRAIPKPKPVKPQKEKEDPLPELRTIDMVDRSGPPLEPTLQDGDPVTLEWIEPGRRKDDDESLIDRIPGGYAGLAVIGVLAAAGIAAAVLAVRRRNEEDI